MSESRNRCATVDAAARRQVITGVVMTFAGLAAASVARGSDQQGAVGGLIVGRNVELVPNQRIVQAWRPASWDPGVYSIVKFELKGQASSTTVVLDHTGFPEGDFRHLDSGWYKRYWEPLRKFLA